ncbi:MAG: autotransporter-associated beta strand repeat-containing protein [Planctomycetota bacterium]|nr:autotransporter-associated beta strand repeat-containing protein [Planctomycetota bacterium]MDA1200065.1 autotransporter-associated beta strand repeat-containing protein [Planctomycetota bacterium]
MSAMRSVSLATKHRLLPTVAFSFCCVAILGVARAADVFKADNATALNVGASWTGGTAPGASDVGVWDSTVTTANTVSLGANLSWQGLRLADPGGDVTLTGSNTLTLGSAGLDTGSNVGLIYESTGTIDLNGLLAGSTALTIDNATTHNWTGMNSVTFTGDLILRGGTGSSGAFSGNWLAFGGPTLTQSGSFGLDTGASLTDRGEFIITDGWGDGGTKPKLDLDSLTGFGDFRSDWGGTGNRTISVTENGTATFQGRITQGNTSTRSVHFEKLGSGSQIFTGANAYANTIVNAGTLQIGDGGATGNIGVGTVSVASAASLTFNRTGVLDYKASARMRTVSGAGDIKVSGGVKIWNYTGSTTGFDEANSWNNFSGRLIITDDSEFQTIRNGRTAMGTAQIVLGDATTSGKLSQIEGNWTWTNNIELVGTANQILNNSTGGGRWLKLQGDISGAGNVTLADPAGGMTNDTLGFILTGTNTLSGDVTVDTFVRVGGVPGDSISLSAGTSGTLGTAAVTINSGKRLTFSRSDSHSVSNIISGGGEVYVGSTGISGTETQILTLTGANVYTGTTTVAAGTLALTGSGSLASSVIDVASGATFDVSGLTGSFALDSGQQLTGSGSILGDMEFGSGSTLAFSTTDTLVVSSGTVSFAAGFGIDDLVGLDGATVSDGTYTLISGTVDFTGLDNVGFGNRLDIGSGKEAYFQQGSLQVVVVPEPTPFALAIGGIVAVAVMRRRFG